MTVGEKQNDNRQQDDRGTAYRIQHERDGAQRESVVVQRVGEHGVAPADQAEQEAGVRAEQQETIGLRGWYRATIRPTAAMVRNISMSAAPPIADTEPAGLVCVPM
jgi:hypothetical protein